MSPPDAETPDRCPRCGLLPAAGRPGRLCPRCVLAELVSSSSPKAGEDSLELRDIPMPEGERGRIGDYDLIEVIAHGGMGVVYKARQRSLGRIVALKLLLGGTHAGAEFRRRFRQEAEMTARLQHPNIVPIYEIGEHDGQPFFSMEFVDGRDLGVISRNSPIEPRLAAEHVREVARGIAYAHGQGVLHRDLKPSNILLGTDCRPRITDFGLARRLNEGSSLTLSGEVLGTPGFLPPEQASIQAGSVGVWSDVYSLGAILYHLLTSRPPFVAGNLNDAIRQVLEEDPLPLRQLNPSAPADLENICQKCLEKAPERRYASATLLAEDLERFLGNRPILARPPSRVYRLRKLLHRHKLGFAAGLLVMTSLSAGLVVSTTMYVRERAAFERARQAEQDQSRQRDRAQAEAAKSHEVAAFLQGMFRGVRDDVAMGRDTSLLRVILDAAARRVDTDLRADPEVQLELHATLAESYASLGLDKESDATATQGLATARSNTNASPLVVARLHARRALPLANLGRLTEAEASARQALAIRREHLPEDSLEVGDSMEKLALVLARREQFGEAASLQQSALALTRKHASNDVERLTESLGAMGVVLSGAGRPQEAEAHYRESLEILRRRLGNRHPRIAHHLHNLAVVVNGRGSANEAENLEREALDITLGTLGRESPVTAQVLGNLGVLIGARGRQMESERYLREAVEIQQRAFGAAHPAVFLALNSLGGCLFAQQKYVEAERLYARALQMVGSIELKSKDIEPSRRLRAWCLSELGRWDEALASTSVPSGTNANPELFTESHYARAMFQARHHFWHQARESMRQALDANRGNVMYQCLYACILARLKDLNAYQAHCHTLLDQFVDTRDPSTAHLVSKFASILPLPAGDAIRTARLADRMMSPSKEPPSPWWIAGKAMCDYRTGAHASAAELTGRLIGRFQLGRRLRAHVLLVNAMATWQLGRTSDARSTWLSAANLVLAELQLENPSDLQNDWAEMVIAWLLMEEARQLIRPDLPPDPTLPQPTGASVAAAADVRWMPGRLVQETYENVLGHAVLYLTNAAHFPHRPTRISTPTAFESPEDPPENSGARLYGYLLPPKSGEYVFYLRADEEGVLYLSPDGDPRHAAFVTSASFPSRNRWPTDPPTRGSPANAGVSFPIPLVAGRRYYVEAQAKYNRPGGHLAVAWQAPGDPPPTANTLPIPGEFLGFEASSSLFRRQPLSVTVNEGESARFSIEFGSASFSEVVWERNWLPIAGENRSELVTPPLRRTDSGSRYRCLLRSPIEPGIAASSEAMVTVVPDTQPPRLLNATAFLGSNQVWAAFSEPMADAKEGASISIKISGRPAARWSFVLDGTVAMVESQAPLQPGDRISLEGLKDANGNPMTPVSDAFIEFSPWIGSVIQPPHAPRHADQLCVPVGTNGCHLVMDGGTCYAQSMADDMMFAFQMIEGDFEISGRLARLDPVAPFAPGGLMVRENLRPDCNFLLLYAQPRTGNAWSGLDVTDTVNSQRQSRKLPLVPGEWVYPSSMPDEWHRIRRDGNLFTTFRSTDGRAWRKLWEVNFSAPTAIAVGPAMHAEGRRHAGHAEYRELQLRRPRNGQRWTANDPDLPP